MFRFLPLLLLLCLSTQTLFAQKSISGKVADSNTEPLEFAVISLNDTLKGEFITGTHTDAEGRFTLEAEERSNYRLSVKYLGLSDYTIAVPEGLDIQVPDIILRAQANVLDQVVVSAQGPEIKQEGDKLIFNLGSSELNKDYDGIEILARAPSLWIDEEDNILTRNGRPMVLINGRPLNMSGETLSAYLRNLQADNIRSIEIQNSPNASSDANNLGGVINIILKKKPRGLNTTLRVFHDYRGEGFYENFAGINFNYGADFWNIYGSYNFSDLKGASDIITDINYNLTGDYLKTLIDNRFQRDRHNYQAGFVLSPWQKHEIGGEFFGRSIAGSELNTNDISLTNAADTLDYGIFISDNAGMTDVSSAVLNYTWRPDTLNSSLKIIADRTVQTQGEANDFDSDYTLGFLTDLKERNFIDNETGVLSLQADFVKNFASGWKTESGLKRIRTERENRLQSEIFTNEVWDITDNNADLTYEEVIIAAYFTLAKKIKQKHYFKAGLRVENTDLYRLDFINSDSLERNYTDRFPSLYYSYDLKDGAKISASYSRRIGRPSFRDLNNIVRRVNDFRRLSGNPDLQPQYINQYELTWQHKKQSLTFYLNQTSNAINGVYTLENGIADYQRQNNGTQTQYGLAYNLTKKITDWWTIRGNARLFNRKFTTEAGEDLFQQVTFDGSASANFTIDKTTGIDVSGRYLSPYADAFYEQFPYYRFDFFIRKSFFKKKLNCRLYFNDPIDMTKSGNRRPFEEITTSLRRKRQTRTFRLWLSYNFATENKAQSKKNTGDRAGRRRI